MHLTLFDLFGNWLKEIFKFSILLRLNLLLVEVLSSEAFQQIGVFSVLCFVVLDSSLCYASSKPTSPSFFITHCDWPVQWHLVGSPFGSHVSFELGLVFELEVLLELLNLLSSVHTCLTRSPAQRLIFFNINLCQNLLTWFPMLNKIDRIVMPFRSEWLRVFNLCHLRTSFLFLWGCASFLLCLNWWVVDLWLFFCWVHAI